MRAAEDPYRFGGAIIIDDPHKADEARSDIMLGLLTHEPNLVLLREQVLFTMKRRHVPATTAAALQTYVHNPNFELLHLQILRDYFSYEFETSNVIPDSPWCLEHCIDDFVFLTFFVGFQ